MGDSKSLTNCQIVDPAEVMSEDAIREESIITKKLIFPSHLDGIKWCTRRKLLKNNWDCISCNIPMTFIHSKRNITDGFRWGCKKCKKSRSLRKGSIFEGSHLTLSQILIILHGWANGFTLEYVAREAECSLTSGTVSNFYNICRKVCKNSFILSKTDIGVEIKDCTSKIIETKWRNKYPKHKILQEFLITVAQQYSNN